MVRASKSDKQSAAPAKVSAPAPAPVESAAASAPAKKATKKSAKPAVEAAPVVVDTPVVVNEVVADVDSVSLSQKLVDFASKLQSLSGNLSAVKTEFKVLEKTIAREIKTAQRSSSKRSKRTANRAPSGFVKPTLISDELAAFLGKDTGSEMARTAVSKEINNYIRTNQLQDKENGRKIHPDAKLSTLLKLQSTDELTYFNLQRYMKHHFIKTGVAAVAV
jgi:chromatin remodeling complex protein RSC6